MQILLPLISGVLQGAAQPLFKYITKNDYSYISYLFIYALVGGIIALPFFIFNFQFPQNPTEWFGLIITCLCLLFGNLLLTRAFQMENVSNIVLVEKVELIISFTAGIILFGEILSPIKLFGALLLILGIIIIFLEKKKFQYSKGLLYSFLGGVIIGIASISTTFTLKTFNPYAFLFYPFIFNTIVLGTNKRNINEATKIFKNSWLPVIIVEFLSVTGYAMYLLSIKRIGLSISSLTVEPTYILVAVGIGVFYLKEKDKILNKIIGTILIIIGLLAIR